MTSLAGWRDALNAIYPGLWNAALGLIVVLIVWGLRRWRPDVFARLPPAVQMLPAMVLSAIVTALSATSPTIGGFLSQLLAGTLIGGTTAIGAHRVLKESPLPYGGPGKPPSLRPPPPRHISIPPAAMMVALLAGLQLSACTPSELQTAVEVASDIEKIAKVLCLADQAARQRAEPRALSVQDLCSTAEQLAPYLPAARHPMLASSGYCP